MRKLLLLAIVILPGCASGPYTGPERGPSGTIAYAVTVETSEPGSKIEADGEYVGTSPVTIKIFGDKDGTFHNFGGKTTYTITAFPVKSGQYTQVKVYHTGNGFGQMFVPEDRIPKHVYLDLSLVPPPTEPAHRYDININH